MIKGAYLLLFSTRGYASEVNENEGRNWADEKLTNGRAGHFPQPLCLHTSRREIAAFYCLLPLCRDLEEIAEVTDKTVMAGFEPVRRIERSDVLSTLLKDLECIRSDGIEDLQDLFIVERGQLTRADGRSYVGL